MGNQESVTVPPPPLGEESIDKELRQHHVLISKLQLLRLDTSRLDQEARDVWRSAKKDRNENLPMAELKSITQTLTKAFRCESASEQQEIWEAFEETSPYCDYITLPELKEYLHRVTVLILRALTRRADELERQLHSSMRPDEPLHSMPSPVASPVESPFGLPPPSQPAVTPPSTQWKESLLSYSSRTLEEPLDGFLYAGRLIVSTASAKGVGGHMPLVEVRVTEGYPKTQGRHDGGPTTTTTVQDCLAQTTLGGSLTLAIPRALSKAQFANYWILISVLDLDVGRRLAVSMGDAVLPLGTAVQKGMETHDGFEEGREEYAPETLAVPVQPARGHEGLIAGAKLDLHFVYQPAESAVSTSGGVGESGERVDAAEAGVVKPQTDTTEANGRRTGSYRIVVSALSDFPMSEDHDADYKYLMASVSLMCGMPPGYATIGSAAYTNVQWKAPLVEWPDAFVLRYTQPPQLLWVNVEVYEATSGGLWGDKTHAHNHGESTPMPPRPIAQTLIPIAYITKHTDSQTCTLQLNQHPAAHRDIDLSKTTCDIHIKPTTDNGASRVDGVVAESSTAARGPKHVLIMAPPPAVPASAPTGSSTDGQHTQSSLQLTGSFGSGSTVPSVSLFHELTDASTLQATKKALEVDGVLCLVCTTHETGPEERYLFLTHKHDAVVLVPPEERLTWRGGWLPFVDRGTVRLDIDTDTLIQIQWGAHSEFLAKCPPTGCPAPDRVMVLKYAGAFCCVAFQDKETALAVAQVTEMLRK
mmetsp:Transcript_8038/g.19788  ORF Transcript_8038/g.19788 Transcript_8038/m.19788 type:complete len:758 (-) Transcript_8038:220-2493(-)